MDVGVTVKVATFPEQMVWLLTVAEDKELYLSVPAAEVMVLHPVAVTIQLYWLLSASPAETV